MTINIRSSASKAQWLKDEPYNPNLPTAKEFIITGAGDFDKEKKC